MSRREFRRGDRHAIKPTSLRLPPELRAWAEREAAKAGKPLRRFLVDELDERRRLDERPVSEDPVLLSVGVRQG